MGTFLSLLGSGLAQGAITALAALGFLVIFKATSIVNFAQGDLITLGAYVAVTAGTEYHLHWYFAYLVAILVLAAVGVIIERIAVAPLRSAPVHVAVIATFGVGLIIETVLAIWKGDTPLALPSPATGHTLHILGSTIPFQWLLTIGIALVTVAALFWMFSSTSVGRQLRAVASDRETAQLYGIPVHRLSMFAWGLAGMLAAMAGVLAAPLSTVNVELGFNLMLGGFAAAVVGGFGSFGGVVVAGFALGLIQQLFGGYVLPDLAPAYPFVLMIVVIAFRPQGMFALESGARL